MKPEWKDAPKWANYLAMDEEGQWYWYLRKPIRDDDCWCGGEKFEFAKLTGVYWKDSLEKRPEEPPVPCNRVRVQRELRQAKEEKDRAAAIAKLTPYERRLLGL